MNGLMMDCPLVIPSILTRAARLYPRKEIVSRREDGTIVRSNYEQLFRRVVRLMNMLRELGVKPGDRVATFAWNTARHLELYFAVPCLGAVLHTVNIRLHRDHLGIIFNHARDRVIFADRSLAGILARMEGDLPLVEDYILMDEHGVEPPELPRHSIDYEELMAAASDREDFPRIDEQAAAGLCYTSGTTGEPKGVLYSHRSTYLHALSGCMVDTSAISERETVLPVVPMFHVNAWGLPYSCTLVGAKQVFPGSQVLDGPLAQLLESERVTLTAGIPAVYNRLLLYLRENPHDLSSLRTIFVGGSAMPRTLLEGFSRDRGITVVQGWGMTETSPVGTFCRLKSWMDDWPVEQQRRIQMKAGLPVVCCELRILDDQGNELPWDGEQVGELVIRGPWVARSYYENPAGASSFTPDGWFRTGDMASIDPDGYMQITDRKKDLIKRKGEWISSVDMENAVLEHEAVLEAAVVGRPDEACDEMPVVFVVAHERSQGLVDAQAIIDLLSRRFARWQLPLPEDVRFVPGLPRTGVGKLDKKELRRHLGQCPESEVR
jgi:fatty-acyl-CoA synthase